MVIMDGRGWRKRERHRPILSPRPYGNRLRAPCRGRFKSLIFSRPHSHRSAREYVRLKRIISEQDLCGVFPPQRSEIVHQVFVLLT
jgi:hypothetical protein